MPVHVVDRSSQPSRFSLSNVHVLAIIAAGVVYVASLLWLPIVIDRLDPLTGDEPFYVMTAISLLDDRDLDEQNNYLDRDFYRFYPVAGAAENGWIAYPDPLPPHATAAQQPGVYSKHGLGTALIIALPWQLGGRVLVLVVLAAISAMVTFNMSMLASRYTTRPLIVFGLPVLLGTTNPLFPFSLLIFPEMPAALCIVYATRRLLAGENRLWQWAAIGGAAAFLPWLHYRLAPVSVVLAIAVVLRLRTARSKADWLAFATLPIASAVLLFSWFNWLYGSPLPPGSDHAGFSGPLGIVNGLVGTAIDQQWGALLHNPIYALALAASTPYAWSRRGDALLVAAVVLPYLGLVSAYSVWWGEWNPPGRYLVDIAPLAVGPLAWWLGRVSRANAVGGLLLAAVPAVVVIATFVWDPQLMYNHPDGSSRVLETWSAWVDVDLTGAVPSFVFYSASGWLARWLATGTLAIVLVATTAFAIVATLNAPAET